MELEIKLKAWLDTTTDTLHIKICDGAVNTMAVTPSVLADLDKVGNVAGFEFLMFTKRYSTTKPAPPERGERAGNIRLGAF